MPAANEFLACLGLLEAGPPQEGIHLFEDANWVAAENASANP